MGKLFKKTSILAAIMVFIQVIYHLALHIKGDSPVMKAIGYVGRAGWISVDVALCLAGFLCFKLFSPAGAGLKDWLSKLFGFLKWTVPTYYLFLLAYLTVGVAFQRFLGNQFILSDGYAPSFLLFYANFLMAKGPHSGVALESLFEVCMVIQLFFGIGLFLALNKNRKAAPIIVGLLWALSIALRFAFQRANTWFTFFNTFTRMDPFLAGLLLAYLNTFDRAKNLLRGKKVLFLCLGTAALVAAAAFTKGLSRYEPMVDAIADPPVALFSLAFVNWVFNRELPAAFRVFPGMDKVTFAVYLIKHPIIYMAEAAFFLKLGLPRSLAWNAAFLGASLILCYLLGFAWYLVVDRGLARVAASARAVASLLAARRGERSL